MTNLSPEDKLDFIIRKVNHLQDLEKKFSKLEEEVEVLRKQLCDKKLRISGVVEDENEDMPSLDIKFKTFVRYALQVHDDIEYDYIRRIGEKIPGRNRPIVVTLLRRSDKRKLLAGKRYLRSSEIFINPELTWKEGGKEKKLREVAKMWKSGNGNLKTQIKNGVLITEEFGKFKTYKLNIEGEVEEVDAGGH